MSPSVHDPDAGFADARANGPPASLAVYGWAYAVAGAPWPGDEEVRRRHPITHDGDGTVVSWPTGSAVADQAPQQVMARLAAALGWQEVPEPATGQVRDADQVVAAAQAEAELVRVVQVVAAAGEAMRRQVWRRLVRARVRWSPARWARRRAHLGLPTQPMDAADAFLAAVVDTLEREAVLAVKGLIEVDQ